MALTLPALVRRWRPASRALPLADVLLTVALVAWAVAATAADPLASHPLSELAVAVITGSLLVRTRAPLVMAGTATVGMLAYAALPAAATPLWSFLAVLAVCFSLGAHLQGRQRWSALLLVLAGGYALQLASVDRADPSDNSFSELFLSPLVIVGGPAFAGALLRRARQQTAELRRLAAELAAERARHVEEATSAERRRIAREIHDVVSHAVTVMVVQAGAAEQLVDGGSEAQQRLHAVRQAGKQALGELRRQLGLMREGTSVSASPLPGLPDIAGLVQASGARFVTTGDPSPEVPPGLGLTAYRAVQEALTNAHRHAPGATVEVLVRAAPDELEIVVEDDGPGMSAEQGSGAGLCGMRERVELYGGSVAAGPAAGRGWRVRVVLPTRGSELR